MTPHQILAAFTRLLAIWWLLYVVSQTPGLYVHNEHLQLDNRTPVIVITVLQLGICAFLWMFPATVARKLLPLKETPSAPPARIADWQMLGVICIGLWALTHAIPDTVYWAILLNTWLGPDSGTLALTVAQRARIASTVVSLVIGIGLVFGARGITTYLFGIRKARPGPPTGTE